MLTLLAHVEWISASCCAMDKSTSFDVAERKSLLDHVEGRRRRTDACMPYAGDTGTVSRLGHVVCLQMAAV